MFLRLRTYIAALVFSVSCLPGCSSLQSASVEQDGESSTVHVFTANGSRTQVCERMVSECTGLGSDDSVGGSLNDACRSELPNYLLYSFSFVMKTGLSDAGQLLCVVAYMDPTKWNAFSMDEDDGMLGTCMPCQPDLLQPSYTRAWLGFPAQSEALERDKQRIQDGDVLYPPGIEESWALNIEHLRGGELYQGSIDSSARYVIVQANSEFSDVNVLPVDPTTEAGVQVIQDTRYTAFRYTWDDEAVVIVSFSAVAVMLWWLGLSIWQTALSATARIPLLVFSLEELLSPYMIETQT